MAPGDAFREHQRRTLERARDDVRQRYGLEVDVYVGRLDADDPRAAATRLLTGPEQVLVALDPASRRVEVVTGAAARQRVADRDVALTVLTMTSSFAVGDLSGGLAQGVRMLGERARPVR